MASPIRLWVAPSAALTVFAAVTACAPAPLQASFQSPNPTERLYAIERAARENDRSAIRDLIEPLDSEDPAVRMLAITALERLTGETMGYRHYAPRQEREEAVARWIEAYRVGDGLDCSAELNGSERAGGRND